MKKIFARALEAIMNTLERDEFLEKHRMESGQFTRQRKLGFKHCVLLILNRLTLSIQSELCNYFERVVKREESVTQQAFSKARQCIKPEAFEALYAQVGGIIQEPGVMHRHHGYRVFAVDGSELALPSSQEIWEKFPNLGKETSVRPHARVSLLCDVLDGYILDAQLDSCTVDERTLTVRHLQAFGASMDEKDLIIFDRGYPSHALIAQLSQEKPKYLMRVSRSFHKEIDERTSGDFCISIQHDSRCYPVRVVAITLPTGEVETLLTNLSREDFKTEDFVSLYWLRWGVETAFHQLKVRLQIEQFSGKTIVSIKQEFFATLLLLNLAAMLGAEATEEIRKKQAGKELRYVYVANYNLLIGSLKDALPRLLLEPSERKRAKLHKQLLARVVIRPCPVRPGRSAPRPDASHARCRASLRSGF